VASEFESSAKLAYQSLSWLPLDVAAEAIVNISLISHANRPSEIPVYHILHPTCFMWSALLDYFDRSGLAFERVRPAIWFDKLLAVQDKLDSSTRSLQSLWKQKVRHATPLFATQADRRFDLFSTSQVRKGTKSLDHILK
jgi:hypothetical protein